MNHWWRTEDCRTTVIHSCSFSFIAETIHVNCLYFTSPPVAPSLSRSPAGCPPCRCLGRLPAFCGRYRSWRKLSRPESRPGFVRAGPHSLTDPLPCTVGSVCPLCFGRYVSDAVPPGRRALATPNFDPLLLLHPHSRVAFLAGSGTCGLSPNRRVVSESLSGGSGAGERAGLYSLPFGFVRCYRLSARSPYMRSSSDT